MGWVIAAVVVAGLLASPWFTADSRDGVDWKPLPPRAPDRLARARLRPFSGSPGVVAIRAGTARLARTVRRGRRARDGPAVGVGRETGGGPGRRGQPGGRAVPAVRSRSFSPSCR